MIIAAYADNRFTRWLDRAQWRLMGATVCRVRGHRQSRYIWGLCGRCFALGWKAPFPPIVMPAPDPHMGCPDAGCGPDCPARLYPPELTHYTTWGWHPASACDAWPECPQRDARGDA